jgi:hypothetical protein
MERFCLVIDESGSKGYADQTENAPGELGVMAGFLVPEWGLEKVRERLTTICGKFLGARKTHITDLDAALQEQMRAAVFRFFQEWHIKWVYEAVYVQGLHENHRSLADLRRRARAARKSPIKLTGNDRQPELLHSHLFLGVFGKAVVFGLDNFGNQFGIRIITDPVDPPILKMFESEARDFLNIGKPEVHSQTGFDPRTGKVEKRSFTISLKGGGNVLDDLSGVPFSIVVETSPLTLAADILANSVHFQLRSAQQRSLGLDLNREEAMAGHPLEKLLCCSWTETETNYVADAVYMRPSVAPERAD